MSAPKALYPGGKPYELGIFDLRILGAVMKLIALRICAGHPGCPCDGEKQEAEGLQKAGEVETDERRSLSEKPPEWSRLGGAT